MRRPVRGGPSARRRPRRAAAPLPPLHRRGAGRHTAGAVASLRSDDALAAGISTVALRRSVLLCALQLTADAPTPAHSALRVPSADTVLGAVMAPAGDDAEVRRRLMRALCICDDLRMLTDATDATRRLRTVQARQQSLLRDAGPAMSAPLAFGMLTSYIQTCTAFAEPLHFDISCYT